MKSLPKLLAAVVVLACCGQVSARTVSHEVTPENIDKQPLVFKVTVKPAGDAKDFEIRVGTKYQPASAAENGSLTVSTCGKKKSVETPPLTIVKKGQTLVYTFHISNSDLDRATVIFTFAVPTPGDYYQFNLDDFLPAEEAPATKPTDLPKPKVEEPGKKDGPETFLVPFEFERSRRLSKTIRGAGG